MMPPEQYQEIKEDLKEIKETLNKVLYEPDRGLLVRVSALEDHKKACNDKNVIERADLMGRLDHAGIWNIVNDWKRKQNWKRALMFVVVGVSTAAIIAIIKLLITVQQLVGSAG